MKKSGNRIGVSEARERAVRDFHPHPRSQLSVYARHTFRCVFMGLAGFTFSRKPGARRFPRVAGGARASSRAVRHPAVFFKSEVISQKSEVGAYRIRPEKGQ